MRDRDGQEEPSTGRSEKRQESESRADWIHSVDGTSGPISRFISEISESDDSSRSAKRSDEARINAEAWLEPIDETSPKMRMAGPEAEKKEVANLGKDIELLRDIDVSKVNDLAWKEITEFIDRNMDEKDTHFHHFDNVDRPMHYAAGTIECIDAIEAQLSAEEFRGYLKGNVIKYLWREKHKGGVESLKKANWYLNKIIP